MAKYDLLRKAIFEEQKEKSGRNNESPISRQALAERPETWISAVIQPA